MSKFKVGDKVELAEGARNFITNHGNGNIYTVEAVNADGIKLKGLFPYYHYNLFKLYAEEDMKEKSDTLDILTPLQAAEAILNEDKLQVYDSDCGKWYTFACGHRNITIEDLKHIKLRLKPKTILINGVEVPAPSKAEDIEEHFYVINFSESIIHTINKTYIGSNFKNYWATKGDAQQVLDAMLIPFNELDVPSAKSNKGDK